MLRANRKPSESIPPALIAAVKTGEEVSDGAMMDVLDQLQAVGARRISLETLDGGGP